MANPNSTIAQILSDLTYAGKLFITLGNPHLSSAIRNYHKLTREHAEKKLRNTLRYMDKRGYIKLNWTQKGLEAVITHRGKTKVEQLELDALEIPPQDPWDKKWRMVIFDVPINRNRHRRAFSDHLKHLGFRMIQKSVWIYPFPCHKQIMLLREWYTIARYVTYLETSEVEDDEIWKRKFGL